ncbi:hypothetical protein PEPS_16870 [Persicobacter psychrovividus]|uniref:Thioredoxin domain-containing protein n=2 Tax=Persicobacter psychrovividus TaxID=387638 RepID=A0ABM7VEQ4_9BACT|nr:hypothetical protein PEPS_16870 [Persicobacter psychrovividus]
MTTLDRLKKHWQNILIGIFFVLMLVLPSFRMFVSSNFQRLLLQSRILQPEEVQASAALPRVPYQWSITDQAGKEVPMSQFEGKTIFLNFWASWCPPCVAELPDILSLMEKTDRSKVAFILLNMDRKPEALERFMKKKGYDFQYYRMHSPLPELLQSQSLPTTHIISPEGKLLTTKKGMAYYDTEHFKNYLENGGR